MLTRRSLMLGSAAIPAAALPLPTLAVAPARQALDDDDLQICEHCGKVSQIEDCTSMGDCWFCEACVEEWRAVFAGCEHEWRADHGDMGDDGGYCQRCAGFVATEDAEHVLTGGKLAAFKLAIR